MEVGERVLARRKNGRVYGATIMATNKDGSYTLQWDSGETRELRQPPCNIWSALTAGDSSCDWLEGSRQIHPLSEANSTSDLVAAPACNQYVNSDHSSKQDSISPTHAAASLLTSLGAEVTVEQLLALPRYVRVVKPWSGSPYEVMPLLDLIRREVSATTEVPEELVVPTSLDDFLAIPHGVSVAHLPSYRCGRLVGQDLASGVAIRALMADVPVATRCHALELCCAPGGKLLYLAELLLRHTGSLGLGHRTVTGA
eukprot:gene28450-35269_t